MNRCSTTAGLPLPGRNSPSARPRFGLAFGLLAFTAALATPWAAWAQGGPAPVRVARVSQREVSTGQPFVGTVTPSRRAVIGSAVVGRMVEFCHNEGDD
ncbi:MAG: hypothetical protein ACKOJF_09670, partial [Planctomycetaceae bacterium]